MNLVSYVAVLSFQIILISAFCEDRKTFQNGFQSLCSPKYESIGHALKKRQINEELFYTSSRVFPHQLAVLNSSAQVGIVMDSANQKVAILNGETGRGIVIDKAMRTGVTVEKGGWYSIERSLEDYLRDANVSHLMDENAMNTFEIDNQSPNSDASKLVESNLVYFGSDLISRILEAKGNIISLALDLFSMVMHPLRNLLGPILDLAMEGWIVIKGGIMALLHIFKWMGKLIAFIVGGFARLAAKAIRFKLNLIITALDGARAFFVMLRDLTYNFDLIEILHNVLTVPAQIAYFIAGLGGEISQGVSGVFYLVAKMFEMASQLATFTIQGFMDILIKFFGNSRPNYQEVTQSASQLLTISSDQKQRYRNGRDFSAYDNFVGTIAGKSSFTVMGIDVGGVVKILTDTAVSSTSAVLTAMKVFKPLFPFGSLIPPFLTGLVRSLDTPGGASYVETILPSVKIPHEYLHNVKSNLLGAALRSGAHDMESIDDFKSLPAPEVLKRLPVISQIYKALDEAVRQHDNTTLDELLKDHGAALEIVELTTKALKTPVE